MKDIELLEAAAVGIEWTRRGIREGTPHGVFRPDGSLSFTRQGFVAVSGLARSLQQNRVALRRGSNFERLRKIVANAVIQQFENRLDEGPTVSKDDLKAVKSVVTDWVC